ncbi:hypothetical protein FJ651_00115 [Paucihalobacter ruber]|uniref:WG repeat protein n=1 Tax=Paucihalobacter ruber TaxID=2567861 RepID=A0A506PNA5_9FLAO|nr:hypothetical protein [Paucihalobacter ruber]TPV35363.1 hypothetical protein FJ651_00115 [Paucihalobacter ruber]
MTNLKLASIHLFVSFTVVLISLSSFTNRAFGQTETAYYPVSEVKQKDGKWGIKASPDWKLQPKKRDWIILPTYDKIELFNYKTKHERYGKFYTYGAFYAWKANKIDVYTEKGLELIISDLSIEDTIHVASFARFVGAETKPFLVNKLCGWKHKEVIIPAQFDSIQLSYDKWIYEEIKVYKNGKMGLMSQDGKILVPLNEYGDIGTYSTVFTSTYSKMDKTGKRLEGMYFDEYKEIPPIYTEIKLISNWKLNDEIPNFYSCELPNGSMDYFIKKDSSLVRPSEAISKLIEEEAAKRKWLNGLVLFAKAGAIGIKDADENWVLPIQATALTIGSYLIEPDDDIINVKNGWLTEGRFTGSVSITRFFTGLKDYEKFAIKAELNPYNSLTGDNRSYFDVVINVNRAYNFKSGFEIYQGICPICDGDGQLPDGYTKSSETITYDRVVKDGTTTITRKNYLANERVDAYGNKYVRTYNQTYDNYKTVKEKKTIVTETKKYKTCSVCEGKKKFSYALILWDDQRNEYVLTTLKF